MRSCRGGRVGGRPTRTPREPLNRSGDHHRRTIVHINGHATIRRDGMFNEFDGLSIGPAGTGGRFHQQGHDEAPRLQECLSGIRNTGSPPFATRPERGRPRAARGDRSSSRTFCSSYGRGNKDGPVREPGLSRHAGEGRSAMVGRKRGRASRPGDRPAPPAPSTAIRHGRDRWGSIFAHSSWFWAFAPEQSAWCFRKRALQPIDRDTWTSESPMAKERELCERYKALRQGIRLHSAKVQRDFPGTLAGRGARGPVLYSGGRRSGQRFVDRARGPC